MFWLEPNIKRSDKEEIDVAKKQNIQIQQLHQKIDSLVNAGLL
jgi:aminopeptidase-like protein